MSGRAASNRGRKWTLAEDKILTLAWGEFGVAAIAGRTNRTPSGVEGRARKLGLRGGRHGLLRVATIAKRTGYDRGTILIAIEVLGIKLQPFPTTEARQQANRRGCRSKGHRGVDEGEDYERLVEYLNSRTIGEIAPRPGLVRGPRGSWGVGKRGAACSGCNRSDRPHYARGLCEGCYMSRLSREWGERGRPVVCDDCKTTERPYEAHGLCRRCYARQRYRRRKDTP
jgi:hypothetical protein